MKKIILKLKDDILAYGLLFLGFILRLLYIFNFTKPESYLWSDAGTYDAHAMRMAKGIHIALSTYWPPFFHIFLSWIYRPLIWLGIENQRVTIDVVLFAIFYIIAFWCIYQIVKKLFSKKIALVVLAALILWYPFIFLNALIMSENLFLPLVFLGLYFLIVKPSTLINGFWMGFFWGLAIILRPIFALAVPFFLLWAWRYKINWKFLLNFTITAGVIIISMMVFNFFYTGEKEKSVSSSGGFNFAMTWCDARSVKYFTEDGYYYWFVSAANVNYPKEKEISTNVPFENQGYYYQLGLDCLKNHPERLVDNFSSIKKLFHSTLFPATGDMAGWDFFRFIFKIITGLLFIISSASIVGLANKWLNINTATKKYLYLFALIILSLFITLYIQNVGEERYIIPYSPLLIILSIPLFAKLYNKIFPIKFSALYSLKPYWIWIFYILLFILSLLLFLICSVNVKEAYLINADETKTKITLPFQTNKGDKKIIYKIILNSNISQKAKINIAFDDIIDNITVNNKELDLTEVMKANNQTILSDWKRGYIFDIPLKFGENKIIIEGQNIGWGYSLKIKQKPFFWIWTLLFISIALPLSHISAVIVEIIFKNKDD